MKDMDVAFQDALADARITINAKLLSLQASGASGREQVAMMFALAYTAAVSVALVVKKDGQSTEACHTEMLRCIAMSDKAYSALQIFSALARLSAELAVSAWSTAVAQIAASASTDMSVN